MTTPSAVAFSIMNWNIYWYGILIATAVLVGFLLASRRARKAGLDPDLIIDLLLIAIPVAVICARLYYVAFTWENYASKPLSILYIWEGGVAIYGAIIGGILAAFIFSRVKKIHLMQLLDICIPSVALGQAIGRWGNFFNQEAFGPAVTNPAHQWFPMAVYIERFANTAEGPWHYATFFYESAWCVIIFITLMIYSNKPKKEGTTFLLYLCMYGLGRFLIEGLRTDSLYMGNQRVSQVLSLILFLAGGILFVVMQVRTTKEKEAHATLEPELQIISGGRTRRDDEDDFDADLVTAADGEDLEIQEDADGMEADPADVEPDNAIPADSEPDDAIPADAEPNDAIPADADVPDDAPDADPVTQDDSDVEPGADDEDPNTKK